MLYKSIALSDPLEILLFKFCGVISAFCAAHAAVTSTNANSILTVCETLYYPYLYASIII